jgi:hypothetical protein
VYAQGSVVHGKFTGRWNPPPVSATNGPLLWPGALRYFTECISKNWPDILNGPNSVQVGQSVERPLSLVSPKAPS